jgi:hypothetical protein
MVNKQDDKLNYQMSHFVSPENRKCDQTLSHRIEQCI